MAIAKAETEFGVITGVPEKNYTLFKGVPYATPPVGKLRLCAPVDPQPWAGEKTCIEWASPSVQQHREWPPREDTPVFWEGSESCLYLNVWTPANVGCSDPKPWFAPEVTQSQVIPTFRG